MANVGGSSSGAARVLKAPERREGRWGPSQLVETDFEAFYTEYHFPRETRFRLPSANETPYTDGVKGEMCFFEAPLKSGILVFSSSQSRVSPITSYPDTNKGWHDRYFFMSGVGWERFPGEDRQSESSLCWAFGSVPDQYRRDIKGLTSLEQAHVDAILEVGSVDWNALVCRENEGWLGFRGCFSYVSPTSGVRMDILVPAVKEIREIGTPSFSISLTVPLDQGEFPSSSRISNLPGIPTSERLGADEGDRPLFPLAFSMQCCYLILLLPCCLPHSIGDGSSLGGIVHSWGVVIGDSGTSALDLANEPTIPAVDVAGSLRSFPFLQARLTRSLSHCVSLVAALDAAELKHDEELESSRLKLRKLEGDLESQRKLVEELRTVARGTHLQMQTYEARVMDLERDIASRDAEVAELRQTVDGLEQGRLDFELSLSREKAELLQRLSDSCASSSKREEALRPNWWAFAAMREAADSFATEKRSLEEARIGLTLLVAELSAVPAFPGDPAVLARRCIGVAMAVLEVAYLREGSRFQVRKEGRDFRDLFSFGSVDVNANLSSP
ncbi:hypothetical protein CJ030_MR1G014071 [Morella rubra]|uniref:Uncharacterized protein n=1 Tax=Morella rubra TaxID=262757 RepID=A0A6A1WMF8_9ROSI|nr:hypothetical protein CJ030_MR1G014071 [Morella rubra]